MFILNSLIVSFVTVYDNNTFECINVCCFVILLCLLDTIFIRLIILVYSKENIVMSIVIWMHICKLLYS